MQSNSKKDKITFRKKAISTSTTTIVDCCSVLIEPSLAMYSASLPGLILPAVNGAEQTTVHALTAWRGR